ncbi:putative inorganic carbon transporter subunit DabA, partial [Mycolicibacter algericus]|uniref:putative inorganic carbon transporter subunit DabA n=1 Tax=Mycolicibacter algericus TaxID=1288388 RepID=UPI003C75BC22
MEFGGDRVIFAPVLGDHADRDQLDGAAVLDELGVVEISHRPLISRDRRGAVADGPVTAWKRAPWAPTHRRPRGWAQTTRPEWGLTRNAAFIIGPR